MRAIFATTFSISSTSTVTFGPVSGFSRRRAGLVDHVDRLVGQVAVVDVRAASSTAAAAPRPRSDAVVLLEARLQALQDLDRLLDRRLDHVDLLEAPRERVVLLEDAAVLLVGGRADAAQLAVREHRLDQVRRVHHAAGRAPAPITVWISSMNRIAPGCFLSSDTHALEALLEVAAVLRAGDQRAHVERVDRALLQHVGDLALDDQPREPSAIAVLPTPASPT
jgi:hypothetical protein